MKQQDPIELYNYHFDTLQAHGPSRAQLIETDPALPADSASLFAVVSWLWKTLRPVAPAHAFKHELRLQLVAESKRQRVQQELGIQQSVRTAWPIAWIISVVLGAASLVGMYAFWRRSRHVGREKTALAT